VSWPSTTARRYFRPIILPKSTSLPDPQPDDCCFHSNDSHYRRFHRHWLGDRPLLCPARQVVATMRTPHKAPADLHSLANVLVLPLDVLDGASIAAAVAGALHAFGHLDVLFNNAGYALAGAFEALSPAQVQQQFNTNVYGVMNVTRVVLPHFRDRQQGLILTTTSVGGNIAFPLYSVYNATKFAVEGFMESLQYEVQQFNIQIRTLVPGTVRTDFAAAVQYVSAPAYDPYAQRVHEQTPSSSSYSTTCLPSAWLKGWSPAIPRRSIRLR
jgi:NAD(P)-dependent dehydrogenase (short-subunit alcohol dehydrogenase family)